MPWPSRASDAKSEAIRSLRRTCGSCSRRTRSWRTTSPRPGRGGTGLRRKRPSTSRPTSATKWSKASFSAAERSVDGERVRNFSADEIVAFARGFGLPVGFFFLPPPRSAADAEIRLAAPEKPAWGIPTSELIDVVFGPPGEIGYMGMRVEEFFRQESLELQTEAQRRLSQHTELVVEAIVKRDLNRFSTWRTMLTNLAQQLEDWQRRARKTVTSEEEVLDE